MSLWTQPYPHAQGSTVWMVPIGASGKTGGDYLKATLPSDRGGSETYKNHPVASLPDAPSFAGLRQGAAYTLAESVTGVL